MFEVSVLIKSDAVMVMAAAPPPMTLTPQATDAFTASLKEQTAALQHQIDTFGMRAEAVARYDLEALDSSDVAQNKLPVSNSCRSS